MIETEYFVLLKRSIVLTEYCNVMIKCEELIGTIEYLTLQTRCRIKRCHFNRVLLHKFCEDTALDKRSVYTWILEWFMKV